MWFAFLLQVYQVSNPSALKSLARSAAFKPSLSRAFAGLALMACTTLPAMAQSVNSTADYVVSLAGINMASVEVKFMDDGSHFDLDLGADVSGVGTLVASGTARADSSGTSKTGALNANGFNLETHANGESFSVDVEYTSGNATGFQIQPPVVNNVGRIPIERKDMTGVTDPMASFILKGDSLSPNLCDRTLSIFTGMERFDIKMSFGANDTATSQRTGYQGPVVLCRLRYVPISGHFEQSEITQYLAQSDKILIWYAPLNNSGYYIPYRVLMGTSVGDLSMVLTGLR